MRLLTVTSIEEDREPMQDQRAQRIARANWAPTGAVGADGAVMKTCSSPRPHDPSVDWFWREARRTANICQWPAWAR